MKTLIIKFGASGDVVRTTALLNLFRDGVDWITTDNNAILLKGNTKVNRIIPESEIAVTSFENYDLVINLEDTVDAARILAGIKYKELFGSYLDNNDKLSYTESSACWFDLSLISKYGIEEANRLKYENQKSFQELVFSGLGYPFNGESYLLPETESSELSGDIAISSKAGNVWPMKNWAYYQELAEWLSGNGYKVNFLPQRATMLEHLADVRAHSVLISGDSLPMHFALGSSVHCITIFICTSPTEIYGYNLMEKIVSPGLGKYFYRRDFDSKAVTSIALSDVISAFNNIIKNRVENV